MHRAASRQQQQLRLQNRKTLTRDWVDTTEREERHFVVQVVRQPCRQECRPKRLREARSNPHPPFRGMSRKRNERKPWRNARESEQTSNQQVGEHRTNLSVFLFFANRWGAGETKSHGYVREKARQQLALRGCKIKPPLHAELAPRFEAPA